MTWLVPFFRPRLRGLLAAQGLALAATLVSLAGPPLAARALDVDVPAGDVAGLVRTGVLYALATLAGGALTWRARVAIEEVAQDGMRRVKEALFGHLVDHDLALHDEQPPGGLIARVQGDTEALRTLLGELVLQAPADLLLGVGLVAVLAVQAPDMALVVGATFPLYAIGLVWFRRVGPARFLRAREVAGSLSGFLSEHLRALPMLRAYGRLEWLRARAEALGRQKRDVEADAGMAAVWFVNGLFAVRALSFAAILWVGALGVERGTLTLGALVMALDYARKSFDPVMRLQFHMLTLERARAGAGRIQALLARAPTIRSPASPRPWPGGVLRLDGAQLVYGNGHRALHGVDLAFPPGAHVALVGPTGSGKSTVVQLLFRFRDPSAGAVTVGGVDVRELDVDELRAHVGLVPQGVHLLPGTVAENLGVDDARAAELLAEVGLDARLAPSSRLGEGGEGLSRGEAQLLCFARAIAAEPGILVLDEATAAMDPATEARIRARIAARQGRTVITVAHRLRTIADADHVYVLHEGRVIEEGTHDALLARDGMYATLWRAQIAGEGAGAEQESA